MTSNSILKQAERWQFEGKAWHFHILSPECLLNDSGKYVLLIENTTDRQSEQVLSTEPYMGIGQELVTLLHGDKVLSNKRVSNQAPPSETVHQILARAKELSAKHLFWHHHMLFPECRFNSHKGQWVLMFEDPETKTILESCTTDEPFNDLQQIEQLFYLQRKTTK